MKKLLITGFAPFAEHSVNPSWLAVQQLADVAGDYALCKLQIPVVYEKAADLVVQQAKDLGADAILCVGLAAGRSAVTPERIAVNIRDARIADNEGVLFTGQRICPDGPAAYFATVPVEEMVRAISDAGLPAAVSNSAGTYVCNDVLYAVIHHFGDAVPAGFIHVPNIPEQGTPNLPLEQIVRALTIAIEAI